MTDFRSLEQKYRQMRIDEAEARNTAARKKVENVGRPQDDNKDPETSKLAKQGEIKTKIIDEEADESSDPDDKFARDAYGHKAPGVKKLKDGTFHAVNADGEHRIFNDQKTAERHAKKTNEEVEQIDEGNAENKEKKNVAAADLGSKNRDEKWNDKIKPDVADKMRGREKMKEEVDIDEAKDDKIKDMEKTDKKADTDLADKEAKTITGGKTEVETHPKTDDRPEETTMEDEKGKKAANKANKEQGTKGAKLKEEKWIQKAIKHKGALHKQLHVPADEPIPAEKLNAAAEKGGKLGQRARLAKTLKRIVKEK